MLKDRKLTYYKSESDINGSAKGIINFDIVIADV